MKSNVYFILLIAFSGLTANNSFSQEPAYYLFGGVVVRWIEPAKHGFGPSVLFENKKRFQYGASFLYKYSFETATRGFAGYTVKPTVNMFIRKRNETSNKLFGMIGIAFIFDYTYREHDLVFNTKLESPVKRYGLGLLPGISLNYRPSDIMHFKTELSYAPLYFMTYGPPCNGNSIECYIESPETFFDTFINLEFSFYYKF